MLQLLSLLCTLMLIPTMQGFGRGPGSYVQGATGFGPNFSRVRAMERNVGADLNKITRAARPDALTTSQISCNADSALLAEIKQCVCQLRNLIERCACSQNEEILNELQDILIITVETLSNTDEILGALGSVSGLDGFTSSLDILISSIDSLDLEVLVSLTDSIAAISSKIDKMDTQLDTIESLLENQENCCSTIDVIGSIISNITASCSGIDEINTILESIGDELIVIIESIGDELAVIVESVSDELTIIVESISDELASRIDADIAIDQTILSVVDKLDTQLDVVESLVSIIAGQNCCGSSTDVITSNLDDLTSVVEQILERTAIIQSEVELLALDLSLLPVIDSKTDVLLFNVGSRTDFAFSQTDQLSTIDQINALDLTVIALLKTILADLHGL